MTLAMVNNLLIGLNGGSAVHIFYSAKTLIPILVCIAHHMLNCSGEGYETTEQVLFVYETLITGFDSRRWAILD